MRLRDMNFFQRLQYILEMKRVTLLASQRSISLVIIREFCQNLDEIIKSEAQPSFLFLYFQELQRLAGVSNDEREQEKLDEVKQYLIRNFGELEMLAFDFNANKEIFFFVKSQCDLFIDLADEEFLKALYGNFSAFLISLINNKYVSVKG